MKHNDINFFISYTNKGKTKSRGKILLVIAYIIIILSIAVYIIFNDIRIKKLSEHVTKLEDVLKKPERLKMINEVNTKEKELKDLKLEIENIKDLEESINEKNFINKEYIESIIGKKPEELFLTTISINSESVSIRGKSNNKLSIAEFGKGLESIENCEDLFISKISKEGLVYEFDLELKLIRREEDERPHDEKEESEHD